MKPFQSHAAQSGFTLVELLLVMAIIGVLSSLALVVVNEAQYDARVSATRARISMLDQIMRQKMELLQERRLPIDVWDYIAEDAEDPRQLARELRRRIKVEILDAEMPRSMWDIAYERATAAAEKDFTFPSRNFRKWILNTDGLDTPAGLINAIANNAPSSALRFRFDSSNYNFHGEPAPPNPPDTTPMFYPEGRPSENTPFLFLVEDPFSLNELDFAKITTTSEYLYLILQATQFNGISAIEAMGNRAIGDSDGDGFLEIIDSWGNPIGFQFEMHYENGDLVTQQPFSAEPVDLNGGIGLDDGIMGTDMLDIENIQVRFVSTGGRSSLAQGSRELVSN